MTEARDHTAYRAVMIPMAAAIPAKFAFAAWAGMTPEAPLAPCMAGAFLFVVGPMLRSRGYREAATVVDALLVLVLAEAFAKDAMFAAVSMSRRFPYADGLLSSWDAALGFRWADYASAFDRSPALWKASKVAYMAMFPQVPLALLVLAYSGQAKRLYAYVGASALALMACFLVVAFFPALGGYVHAGGTGAGFVHTDFEVGDCMTATLELLRAGLPVGPNPELALISFPSYHAVCAVLGIWAFWGVRFLRWPALATNLAMLAATPVQGSHYLVDVLAGVAVAVASLAAVRTTMRMAGGVTPLAIAAPNPAFA